MQRPQSPDLQKRLAQVVGVSQLDRNADSGSSDAAPRSSLRTQSVGAVLTSGKPGPAATHSSARGHPRGRSTKSSLTPVVQTAATGSVRGKPQSESKTTPPPTQHSGSDGEAGYDAEGEPGVMSGSGSASDGTTDPDGEYGAERRSQLRVRVPTQSLQASAAKLASMSPAVFQSSAAAAAAAASEALAGQQRWPLILEDKWVLCLSPAGQMAYLSVALGSRRLDPVREATQLVTKLLQVRRCCHE